MRTARQSVAALAAWFMLAAGVARAELSRPVAVGPQTRQLIEADWLDRDARYAPMVGATTTAEGAVKRNEFGVTTTEDAAGGCDGVKNGRWGFHTASGETDPWWQVDLGADYRLDRVVVFNRIDSGKAARTGKLHVLVANGDQPEEFSLVYQHDGSPFGGVKEGAPLIVSLKGKEVVGRMVRLRVPGSCSFALDEVEVYGAEDPRQNLALGKPADQKSVSKYSYPGTLPENVTSAPPPRPVGGGFTLAHTREVVERAKGLVARLEPEADVKRLVPLVRELKALVARLSAHETGAEPSEPERKALYLDACWLSRKIAFCNPLLDLDRLLFVKRHDSGGVFHMCDQFYGCNAKPGGGLYVLSDPFGDNPQLTNLLADSVVERGRLRGRTLAGGSFLSPELSFDGRTILFAYSECQAKQTYTWGPTISQHLFLFNADGSGLVQLTDGDPDDFDPCLLPNGRIAFISLRRGGFLRCGRHCPVYTLFSMGPKGDGILPLSHHETHEWQPSVDNNGMLVYSRWDYVDRDTNIAHHLWTCYPDGRDPRSFHGNYPERRESRPWMELSIRAIPGSDKYVAVTGAHHGHAFGSLVLIDPSLDDDGAMSQLTRLTPDVPFPEAEGRPIPNFMCYGTPWPLSEDDYLCVYDAAAKNRGLYWIDRFGNRELLYRDPEISCLSPIPLRPRPTPPVIPTVDGTPAGAFVPNYKRALGTLSVLNVYDSDFDWPQGTKITDLRLIQLLPKTTPPPNEPRIGVANQTNARAVLGTVPVETDGSAHFEAPAGAPIYFQALDARGLAVQSMRSVTYIHPGERLTCHGCHEPKRQTRSPAATLPAALTRAPSRVSPEVEGANPFNYVRLVQPALDRNCVSCHQQKKALDLTGAVEKGFTRSYNNLAGEYGFYYHVSNGSINQGVHGGVRSVPGQFGARASALLRYLDERHHGVKLSAEDFHRVTLWLDCNSEFFGAYEDTEGQLRGELVKASLE